MTKITREEYYKWWTLPWPVVDMDNVPRFSCGECDEVKIDEAMMIVEDCEDDTLCVFLCKKCIAKAFSML